MRGTGRTTRMLQYALKKASHGCKVYVVASNQVHKAFFRQQLEQIKANWIDFPIEIITMESSLGINIERLTFDGMPRGAIMIVDHYTAEGEIEKLYKRIGNLQAIAHRWDYTDAHRWDDAS